MLRSSQRSRSAVRHPRDGRREPRAPLRCTITGRQGRTVDPARRDPQAVQRAQHPHFAAFEFLGAFATLLERRALGAGGVEHEADRDARDARHRVGGPHEHTVVPPEQAAVRALDDAALGVENDGLARAERLHGGAESEQGIEVGALHKRPCARVARRCGDDDLRGRRGSRAQAQPPLAAALAGAKLEARKPVAVDRQCGNRVTDEALGGVELARALSGDTCEEPGSMPVEPASCAVDHAPGVGDEQCALVRVAPVDALPGVATTGYPRVQAFLSATARDLGHTLQRMRRGVLEHPVAAPLDPESVAAALEREHPAAEGFVWLDSGIGARTGRSLLAIGERVHLDTAAPVLPQLRSEIAALAVPTQTGAAPVPLGLIGWFGYELRDETMGLPVEQVAPEHRAAWLRVDRGISIDHETGDARLVALDREGHGEWSGELDDWRQRMLALLQGAAPASVADDEAVPALSVHWRDTDEHYAELVRACQRSIREGDAYQLCLTTQAELETTDGAVIDAAAVYRRLRRSSPAHHGARIRIGATTLLSASPETFLRVADGVVQTRPIKGTRPRDADAARDAALAAELAASDKEQAENLMIVDLMRNDLSRVSEVGSVTVTGLLEVESYAHVHQLVSTVEGRLQPGLDALDAVAACLPAGSMTGAPKRRAIELLAELEAGPRGVYSGAFGYLGADGSADLAMVIRSIVIEGGRATIGAGGGITALSEPLAEVAEMRLKAAALLRALGAGESHDQTVI